MKATFTQPMVKPLSADQRFDAYRRMLASASDEEVHWWYFGTTFVSIDGLPQVPTIDAATLMVYRSETLSNDRFAIHWDEVGYFTDYVTGQPVTTWRNPLTGTQVDTPQGFAEGPARYEISRAEGGVVVSLTQPGASVKSIEVEWQFNKDRVSLIQRERKTRGFPEVDGKLPDPNSSSGFEAVTELAFLDRRDGDGRETQGLYAFALAGAPPWMGFDPALRATATVRGVICKATPHSAPDPDSLLQLQQRFPEFFIRHGG